MVNFDDISKGSTNDEKRIPAINLNTTPLDNENFTSVVDSNSNLSSKQSPLNSQVNALDYDTTLRLVMTNTDYKQNSLTEHNNLGEAPLQNTFGLLLQQQNQSNTLPQIDWQRYRHSSAFTSDGSIYANFPPILLNENATIHDEIAQQQTYPETFLSTTTSPDIVSSPAAYPTMRHLYGQNTSNSYIDYNIAPLPLWNSSMEVDQANQLSTNLANVSNWLSDQEKRQDMSSPWNYSWPSLEAILSPSIPCESSPTFQVKAPTNRVKIQENSQNPQNGKTNNKEAFKPKKSKKMTRPRSEGNSKKSKISPRADIFSNHKKSQQSKSQIDEEEVKSIKEKEILDDTESVAEFSKEIFKIVVPPSQSSGEFQVKTRYLCPFRFCDKDFSTSGHARRHSRVHETFRKYACPHVGCSATFTRSDNCRQHQFNSHKIPLEAIKRQRSLNKPVGKSKKQVNP